MVVATNTRIAASGDIGVSLPIQYTCKSAYTESVACLQSTYINHSRLLISDGLHLYFKEV